MVSLLGVGDELEQSYPIHIEYQQIHSGSFILYEYLTGVFSNMM
jgi:hypothetical protein